MSMRLRDGLSWCLCLGRSVFLDLECDRYFCLPSKSDDAFQRWAAGEAVCAAALRALEDCGVIQPGAGERARVAAISRATRDLAALGRSDAAVRDIVDAAIAQYRARRALRRQPLATLIAQLARISGDGRQSDADAQELRIAKAFDAVGNFLRSADQCLARAIAARWLCNRRGVDAILVLGVRLEPFSAHAWVQSGDSVIVGELEQVRLYTPIRVVA